MPKKAIRTEEAPQAIGPYSQAVLSDGWLFVSGQLGFDPASGKMIDGDVKAETEQVIKNLKAILESAGLGLDKVVKTTVYLRSLADFAAMNEVYSKYFKDPFPARATVEVTGLPRGAAVEIEAVAEV